MQKLKSCVQKGAELVAVNEIKLARDHLVNKKFVLNWLYFM